MELKYLSLLCSLFLSIETKAFTLNNSAAAAFSKDDVSVNVADLSCPNINLSTQQLLDMAHEAVEKFWNTVPTSRLRLQKGSIKSVSSAFGTDTACSNASANTSNCTINSALVVDSDILIACNNNSSNYGGTSSVLGITVPNNISGSTINGALILINTNSGNSFEGLSYDEQVAVIAHEIGHAVGLGHSEFNSNLMYHTLVPTREALGSDDRDGLTWLYPTEQPLAGCGTIDFTDRDPPSGGPLQMALAFLFFFLSIKLIKSLKLKEFSQFS